MAFLVRSNRQVDLVHCALPQMEWTERHYVTSNVACNQTTMRLANRVRVTMNSIFYIIGVIVVVIIVLKVLGVY